MGEKAHIPLVARLRTALRNATGWLYVRYLNKVWGMDIGPGTRISLSARLDRTNPRGVHIGAECSIAFDAAILTHDFVNRVHKDVYIGNRCLIGARCVIYPGVRIGDGCIVSAASVVMKDVPPGSMVAGSPARVVESGIKTGPHGYLIGRTRPVEVVPAAVAS